MAGRPSEALIRCPELAKELGCSPAVLAAWSGAAPQLFTYTANVERAEWFEFTPSEADFLRERVMRWRERCKGRSGVVGAVLEELGEGVRKESGPLRKRVMSKGGWSRQEVGEALTRVEAVWTIQGKVKREDGTVEHNVLFVEVPRL